MLIFKKKKIVTYLQNIPPEECVTYNILLADYLDGTLKNSLYTLGISKANIHIDWLEHHKCIGIQGKYENYYMDLHIYPDEFMVAFDLDEADEDIVYPLTSKAQFFQVLYDTIAHLK